MFLACRRGSRKDDSERGVLDSKNMNLFVVILFANFAINNTIIGKIVKCNKKVVQTVFDSFIHSNMYTTPSSKSMCYKSGDV